MRNRGSPVGKRGQKKSWCGGANGSTVACETPQLVPPGPAGVGQHWELVTYTPETSQALLDSSPHNIRRLMRWHYMTLARAMKAGRWDVNGECIKINSAGHVVDGQHRLKACIEAGVPFTTWVLHGVDQINNVDCGSRRHPSQIIARSGAAYATATMAMIPMRLALRLV